MKLSKRIIAVLAAAILMLMCAVPVFAESVSDADAPVDVLLSAPASNGDVASAADVVTSVAQGADAPANVGVSFTVMGYGMLGIFIVMIIIMLVIILLNALTKPRKK